jgi:hypothetical protein
MELLGCWNNDRPFATPNGMPFQGNPSGWHKPRRHEEKKRMKWIILGFLPAQCQMMMAIQQRAEQYGVFIYPCFTVVLKMRVVPYCNSMYLD